MTPLPSHLLALPEHEVKTQFRDLSPAGFEDWTYKRTVEVAKAARLIHHDSVQSSPTNIPSAMDQVIVDNTLGYAKNLSMLSDNLRGLQLRLAARHGTTQAAARDREDYQVTISFVLIGIILFFPQEAINAQMERARQVNVSANPRPLPFCPVAEHNSLRLQASAGHPAGAWVLACQAGGCEVRLGDARREEDL